MRQKDILNFLKKQKEKYSYVFEKIALFGSYAKNKETIFSDIDIAIKLNKNFLKTYDVWEYFNAINSLKEDVYKEFKTSCDVFDLDSDTKLKKEILKNIIYI